MNLLNVHPTANCTNLHTYKIPREPKYHDPIETHNILLKGITATSLAHYKTTAVPMFAKLAAFDLGGRFVILKFDPRWWRKANIEVIYYRKNVKAFMKRNFRCSDRERTREMID